jgi:hypothetical protein
MTDTNHVGDLNEMGGDTSHGDAVAKCGSCGVPWVAHMGIEGTCAENKKLREERDVARRWVCDVRAEWNPFTAKEIATKCGWDCFKEEETP